MFSGFIGTQSGLGNGEEGNIFYIFMFCVCMLSHDDSLQPHGLQLARLLCQWDSPGRSTGVGCHFFLQGIFPAQRWNPHLLHWQVDYFTSEPPGKAHLYVRIYIYLMGP